VIHLGSLSEAPFTLEWFPPEGTHQLSAVATDSEGLTAASSVVTFTANPALPCRQSSESGDFEYEFTGGTENPEVTFIPSRAGVGSNIVILYYGLGGGPYPGYIIQPNTPFPINAGDGETIGFYFTYSVPEGGERNTAAENASYTIGTCAEPVQTDPALALLEWQMEHFTPAELANAELEATLWGELADPDGDEVANFLEFTTGGDPMLFTGNPVEMRHDPLSGEWRIRYPRRSAMPASYSQLEWSTNLVNWSTEGINLSTVSMKEGIEYIEASVDQLNSGAAKSVFIRLTSNP
jgi:hypothetical protein